MSIDSLVDVSSSDEKVEYLMPLDVFNSFLVSDDGKVVAVALKDLVTNTKSSSAGRSIWTYFYGKIVKDVTMQLVTSEYDNGYL